MRVAGIIASSCSSAAILRRVVIRRMGLRHPLWFVFVPERPVDSGHAERSPAWSQKPVPCVIRSLNRPALIEGIRCRFGDHLFVRPAAGTETPVWGEPPGSSVLSKDPPPVWISSSDASAESWLPRALFGARRGFVSARRHRGRVFKASEAWGEKIPGESDTNQPVLEFPLVSNDAPQFVVMPTKTVELSAAFGAPETHWGFSPKVSCSLDRHAADLTGKLSQRASLLDIPAKPVSERGRDLRCLPDTGLIWALVLGSLDDR